MKAATELTAYADKIETISIHAAREGGDVFEVEFADEFEISIHAAREGGDVFEVEFADEFEISIHAAREGGDCLRREIVAGSPRFQSTPPVKAATQRHFEPCV